MMQVFSSSLPASWLGLGAVQYLGWASALIRAICPKEKQGRYPPYRLHSVGRKASGGGFPNNEMGAVPHGRTVFCAPDLFHDRRHLVVALERPDSIAQAFANRCEMRMAILTRLFIKRG